MVKLLRTGKVVFTRDMTACDTSFTHAHAIDAGSAAMTVLIEQSRLADQQQETSQGSTSVSEETVEADSTETLSKERYVIGRIVDRQATMVGRGSNRREVGVRYKIRWEGYDESGDTWQDREQLIQDGAQDTIDLYEAQGDARQEEAPARMPPVERANRAMKALLQDDALSSTDAPETHAQALSGRFGPVIKWEQSMDDEWDGCIERGVWEEINVADLPTTANVLPVKWVFKVKTDEDGKVTAFKARLTPKGFRQLYGIDYNDVFAPTGKYKAMRVALSLAVLWDFEIEQLDVKQAFLNADLKEEVYMEMPEGYKKPGTVLRLRKALYGLKQAPREWQQLIDGFLRTELGFVPTVSDPCLYVFKSKGGRLIILFLFVDDMQVSFHRDDAEEWSALKATLLKRFDTKDMGSSTWMLAMATQAQSWSAHGNPQSVTVRGEGAGALWADTV